MDSNILQTFVRHMLAAALPVPSDRTTIRLVTTAPPVRPRSFLYFWPSQKLTPRKRQPMNTRVMLSLFLLRIYEICVEKEGGRTDPFFGGLSPCAKSLSESFLL